MKKLVFLAIFTAFFLSLGPIASTVHPANALDLSQQEGFKGGELPGAFGQGKDPTDVRTIAVRMIKIALTLLGTIFLALMFYGGFKWMTAAGNEDQVGEAKKLIIQATIGLVIILSSYSLTVFVAQRAQKINQENFDRL